MRVELQRRPDGIGVRFCAAAPPRPLLDSFKRAIPPRVRRYDAAGQWVVKEGYHSFVLLWASQARHEFGASFEDRLRDQTGRPRSRRRQPQAAPSLPVPRWLTKGKPMPSPAAPPRQHPSP